MEKNGTPVDAVQRWKKRTCDAAIWCSRLFFLASAGLFSICCIRLMCRFFFPNIWKTVLLKLTTLLPPIVAQSSLLNRFISFLSVQLETRYNGFLNWCVAYMHKEATSAIFVAVGLVNYSYSYIVASREKNLYGIRLYEVMHALFPWYGVAYGLHGAWVIVGLYCSASEAPLMAATCMVGIFFIFISTNVVMYLFNSDNRRKQMMVEYYLCRFGESTSLYLNLRRKQRSISWSGAMAYMFHAADYLRQYYLATQKVPEAVAQSMWKRLLYKPSKYGLPVAFLEKEQVKKENPQRLPEAAESPCAQLGDLYETSKQITQLCRVWQRMLTGLSPDKQADLIRQVLWSVARSCPYDVDPNTSWRYDSAQNDRDRIFFALPLCALVSCLLDQERPAHTVKQYWKGWERCVSCVFLASTAHLGELEDNEDTQKYRFLVQQIFVLVASTLIAECSVLKNSDLIDGNKLWRQIRGLSQKLCVPLSQTKEYFLWGRCITLSSSDDLFSAPQGLDVQQTYDFLCIILGFM